MKNTNIPLASWMLRQRGRLLQIGRDMNNKYINETYPEESLRVYLIITKAMAEIEKEISKLD